MVVLFVASLALFTRNNRFSFDYHPDEDGKTHQIIKRERNYHHPLLLLNATDLAVHLAGVPLTNQRVVVAGRWVSAVFAAGAVAALAFVGFLRGGWLGAWLSGVLVATHARLYEAAHYLKEDTALMFGIGLFLVAAEVFTRTRTLHALRFLGVACAVAASGKYIGILTLFFAIPLVWYARELASTRRWRSFAVAFGLTFLVLNIPPTTRVSSPFRSVKNEIAGVTVGHHGMMRDVPHAKYFPELRDDLSGIVLITGGLAVIVLAAYAIRRRNAGWALALFPLVYFVMLCFSPKTGGRYLLPVTTMLCALTGFLYLEVARAVNSLKKRRLIQTVVGCAAIATVTRAQLPLLYVTMNDFRHDDRVELATWIRANIPAEAIIVEDHRVGLVPPAPGEESAKPQIPQRVLDSNYAADLATLEELRSWGIVYVAVSPRAYNRFFSADLTPTEAKKGEFQRRRKFYAQLFEEGELVWQRESRGIAYLQPGLKLYKWRTN